MRTQKELFEEQSPARIRRVKTQLLKWIGNKQRFALQIVSHFPLDFGAYFEPFLGSGAVMATLGPISAMASDAFGPLMEIWHTLHDSPETLKGWYAERWERMRTGERATAYEEIKASYNSSPNGADLVFLCRACYGGVVRFRKSDGHMSTQCGPHEPISPRAFARRVDLWRERTRGAEFFAMDYTEAMAMAKRGDFVYCDPPYSHSQSILYGAQEFRLVELLDHIGRCKARGVRVALSIDGTKRSGNMICDLPLPSGLFEREVFINCGRSMLKRLQMNGKTLEGEVVSDRLMLTY